MGARVAVPEKDSLKGVMAPDINLKKKRRITPKRGLSCGSWLGERGEKNRGKLIKVISPWNTAFITEYAGIL